MAASAPGSAPRQVKRLTADTSVGVLGLGEIGREIAFAMRREGFNVRGLELLTQTALINRIPPHVAGGALIYRLERIGRIALVEERL
jgi:phosphoglycerate dehydrogenase-like enzyme